MGDNGGSAPSNLLRLYFEMFQRVFLTHDAILQLDLTEIHETGIYIWFHSYSLMVGFFIKICLKYFSERVEHVI